MIYTYRELPVATKEETRAYLQAAKEFLKTTGLYFSPGEGYLAVADYMAAQDGKQLNRS